MRHSLDGRKADPDPSDDPTQLLSTVTATELFGLVSLLYGMLLHSGAPSKRDASPPPLADVTQAVTVGGLRLINAMAGLSRTTTQVRPRSERESQSQRDLALEMQTALCSADLEH